MTDPPTAPTLDALADAVRTVLASSYAHPVVVAQPARDRVAVLGGKPLALAREQLPPSAAERVVELDLDRLEHRDVPGDGLQMWRQRGCSGSRGELVTELQPGDPPVRLVVDDAGWRLVRTWDGAMGWLDPTAAPLGAVVEVELDAVGCDATLADADGFVEQALGFLDVPYVWGGTTRAGLDCSGLVQRAAWNGGGTWLPRHSRALLTVGDRVAPSRVERGDVLVLQRDPKTYGAERRAQLEAQAAAERRSGSVPSHGPAIHPMHVAIALSPSEALHASRDAMRVTREPIASLLTRYRVLGVRRLGAARAGGEGSR